MRHFSMAPETARLELVEYFVEGVRRALALGVHRADATKPLRDILFAIWERPEQRKYSPERVHSVKASKHRHASQKHKAKKLRADHVVPLNLIIDGLIAPDADVEAILDRLVTRLVTVREDRLLTEAGLRDDGPDGWDWKTGDLDARYKAVGIAFD